MSSLSPYARQTRLGRLFESRGGFGAGDLARPARFRALVVARQDLEVGDIVELGRHAAVLGEVDDQAVKAGTEAVVVDLGPGRGGVAAGRADLLGEDAVGARVLGVVEGFAEQAAFADRAVDRVGEFL